MTTLPTVSVIIPVYNGEQYIETCIDSALAQTYESIEIIAIDDGSTDQSLNIIKKYEPSITVITKKNEGTALTRNLGINKSKGEFIAFLDQDDIWEINKIEQQVSILNQYNDAILVYCDIKRIGHEGIVFSGSDISHSIFPSGYVFNTLLFTDNAIVTPSQVMVRRSALEKTQGFHEPLKKIKAHYDDFFLWLELSLIGPFIFLPKPLISYRRHMLAGSLNPKADYGRLLGRFYICGKLEDIIKKRNDPHLSAAYYSLFYKTSLTLAWFSRQNKFYKKAITAYLQAIRLKPFSIHTWSRLLISLFNYGFSKISPNSINPQ